VTELEQRQLPKGSGGCSDKRRQVLQQVSLTVLNEMGDGVPEIPSSSRQLASCTASICDSKRLRHTAGSPRLVSARAPLRVCATKQPEVANSTDGSN
jgi:hypothetical protein